MSHPLEYYINTNINEPQTPISFRKELKQIINERNLLTAKSRKQVCSMLDSPSDNNILDKRLQFRFQAISEIMISEKTYLNQLEIFMKYFIIPLREKNIIAESIHKTLFGQIEMIYNLNGEFLKELEADLNNVGISFSKMAPFFKIYSIYAFDYKKSLLILQELSNKNLVFRKFLQDTESRPEVQTKLNSLMIVPIQRIPRYKLLLGQVLLYTSPADVDFKILKESIKLIESTACHINSVIEDQEATLMLLNLQNSLVNRTPNIVKPSRKIIKEGILNKITRNGTQIKRFCILMSDIFMYCKILKDRPKNTLTENSLECCCIFPLKKCKIYELFPGNFKISCLGDGLLFCTKDLHVGQSWIVAIQDAIELYTKCRQTLRKESSKRKPIRRKDIRNFELDLVFSPNSRKFVDYEKVFYCKNADETNSIKTSCFNMSTIRSNIFKRKYGRESSSQFELTPTELDPNRKLFPEIVQEKQLPLKRTPTKNDITQLSDLSYNNILRNPSDDYDQTYGFANRLSVTKSYFRTNNIDSTIPTSVLREEFEQVIVDGISRNLDNLYPLSNTTKIQTNSILSSEKENRNPYSIRKIKATDDSSYLEKKRVKFNDVPITLLKPVNDDICLKKDKSKYFEKPQSFQFPNENEGDINPNSMRKRIANFFSRLF